MALIYNQFYTIGAIAIYTPCMRLYKVFIHLLFIPFSISVTQVGAYSNRPHTRPLSSLPKTALLYMGRSDII